MYARRLETARVARDWAAVSCQGDEAVKLICPV